MAFKKLLVLLILAGGLSSYIYFYELPQQKQTQEKEQLLPADDRTTLAEITIKNEKGSFGFVNPQPATARAVVSESPSFSDAPFAAWRVLGLPNASVDSASVGALVQALLNQKLENPIPQEEVEADLELYGLREPAMSISVTGKSGVRVVRIGKENAYIGKRYAQVVGDTGLYMIEPALFSAASKGLDEYRNKRPFDFTEFDIQEAQIVTPDNGVTVVQGDDFSWKITAPIAARGSSTAITEYLRKIRNLKVVEFLDPKDAQETLDLTQFGLQAPEYTLKIAFKEASKRSPRQFQIGRSSSGDYIGREEGGKTLFKFDPLEVQAVKKVALLELRERSFVKIDTASISRIQIESQGSSTIISKSGDTWSVDGAPGDRPFIEGYLKELHDLIAVDFPPAQASLDFGFATPLLKVTLEEAKEGEKPVVTTLVVGAPVKRAVDGASPTAYYVGVGDLSEPFIISDDQLKKITPQRGSLVPAGTP
jgi:hypothetical protein